MSKFSLPCIVCKKPLVNIDEGVDNQPYGGTEFVTKGHYGSTIIDEMGKNPFEFVVNICDTCILRAIDASVIQSRTPDIALSRHPVNDKQRAWVLAQNEKKYGSAWGDDQPVDYVEQMRKSGWTLPLEEED